MTIIEAIQWIGGLPLIGALIWIILMLCIDSSLNKENKDD